jgi:polynucleotide kinase-phosphatase
MKFTIPDLCLVVLVGPSGCGKSTFARKHFKPTEVLSSDYCRGLVSDDENSQEATGDAFDVLQYVAAKRLGRGLLTVVDATNVQPEARQPLVELAREHDVLPVAIVLNLREDVCHERNRGRPDRDFGPHVVRNQSSQLRRSLRGLEREGFRYVHVLHTPEEVEQVSFERQPLWNNRRWDKGPFDIIGDVHGCFDELVELLEKLGYALTRGAPGPALPLPSAGEGGGEGGALRVEPRNSASQPFTLPPHPNPLPQGEREYITVTPPAGRKAVFLGDLVDRGPKSPEVLRLVMGMVAAGTALCVPGNHDVKLLRKLRGKNVQLTHGLAETVAQLAAEPPEFSKTVEQFIDALVGHYVLDDGRLVVAHAGLKQRYVGRASQRVREFALYGETTGETDEFGLPVRHNWAAEYRGPAAVVYGHTPVPEADWLNRTINIDTGCVFGGKLTALRWPEREVFSVPARRVYAEPSRPFLPEPATNPAAASLSAQQQHDEVLDLDDVLGKRIIDTRLMRNITVRAENAAAALEVMSRFAADPRWLIYLPPTMSPTETTDEPGLLEHPREAFAHFRGQGVGKVVCEEKHMGSRAVAVVCRDEQAARRRFGVTGADAGAGAAAGIVYTRTGRRFFDDPAVESALLSRVRAAADAAGLWEEFQTDWLCLDCELMPWSAKAQDLLKNQYAAVGSAARSALPEVVAAVGRARDRYRSAGDGDALAAMLERQTGRLARAGRYVDAYRRYCWPVRSPDDLRLAPFHLLATEGAVHVDKDHAWHMRTLARLTDSGAPTLMATAHHIVDVADPAAVDAGVAWWEELTGRGGEGMVVKPLDFVVRGRRGLVQPAVKCRGPEYLRIIYGPEYDAPANLERLRARGLAGKRSLALREFALGVEALERFVRREPLRRVHECVFGVLALESEPVDPRL